MADEPKKLLDDAIARNTAAIVSLPSAGMLRNIKSRFVSDRGDLVWMESSPDERPLIDELIASEQVCGVSFRAGIEKVTFVTRVLRREAEFRVNETISVEAIALAIPDKIKAAQRRSHYRVKVVPDDGLRIRVWRLSEGQRVKDQPSDRVEVQGELIDLSVGGAGVVFKGANGEPPKISEADRLRVELKFRDRSTVVEGKMTHPVRVGGDPTRLRAGLQFVGLQNGIEGRQILSDLTKFIGELQREEVKRARRSNQAA